MTRSVPRYPGNELHNEGPLKATYNPAKKTWEMKYEFRSKAVVPSLRSSARYRRNGDETSDYGTMSKIDEDAYDDLIPALRLGEAAANENEHIFGDVTIEERKARIESIISEITAVPRLSEANLTQRSRVAEERLRKFLSNENLADRRSVVSGSRNSGRLSRDSRTSVRPPLQRSISSPKLDVRVTSGSGISNMREGQLKQPLLPRSQLERPGRLSRSESQTKPGSRTAARLNHSEELSSMFLPSHAEARGRYLPCLGEDTQNELMLAAPTLGDTTSATMDRTNQSILTRATSTDSSRPKNFILENIRSTAEAGGGSSSGSKEAAASSSRPDSCATTLIQPKHKTGTVPKYLKARQAQWREEAETALASKPDPDCPPGHVRISEDDRLAHLEEMEASHAALLQDLNRLPVSSDTRRVVQRRAELEGLLGELDMEIRLFSRPKVFVKKEG